MYLVLFDMYVHVRYVHSSSTSPTLYVYEYIVEFTVDESHPYQQGSKQQGPLRGIVYISLAYKVHIE